MKTRQITFEGFKDRNILVTVSNDGIEILISRGNKIDTLFLHWVEWNKIVAAVKEAIKENE
ncbi:MAG: hypothetical protein DRI61_08290 [Chloroflexi bacterium]|nr:MAG: hypothetical protein DRI61_08290 [Chloroflexota bacterium]